MTRNPKQIYTATKKDSKIIREWLDAHQMSEGDEKKLWFSIMDFYFDWIFKYSRKIDSIYHNSIYKILVAIGMNPKTDKELAKKSPIYKGGKDTDGQ